ncbi:type IX secretion system outer membrane channel protein PorV [Fodinibius salsisoli]|uniref:Type IX secretion system outer membrane channel protein PorV n=1 Tax=Fodinibius salsisoli TaxID=2820877 RepID=A0ABT3PJG1_9BACT|nr:type IX secretion system outer membrane channel protein PorV [Fodinibius salsisoli]MCW9705893.1 type IX secretion system outer membrane channel protein PorV [Fodinibius salsisoli]
MKKILSTFAFLLICVAFTQAQVGTTSVLFLQIEPDSRAAGMGNTGVAIADNASAVFWNPAGLAFQTGNQVSITHSEWLPQFNADLFYDYLVGKYHVKDIGTFGAHITYLNLGEQKYTSLEDPTGQNLGRFNSYEFAGGISYGYRINQKWSVGTSFRFIYSSLADITFANGSETSVEPGSSFGVDLASMYKSDTFTFWQQEASWTAGINISNIGPGIKYTSNAEKDPLPTTLRLGWSFTTALDQKGINTLTLANDLSKVMAREGSGPVNSLFTSWDSFKRDLGDGRSATLNTFQQLMVATGIEYWYDDLFAVRSGYYYEDPNNGDRQFMTFGAGLRYQFLGVDFSYIYTLGDNNHPLANTTRFGLLLNF